MKSGAIYITVDAATPLCGEVDVEALIATIPEHYTVRGIFIAPLAVEIKDDFDKLIPKLCAPPPSGKYLAFASYPIRDHLRVIDAAACRLYPAAENREAHRLRARAEFGNFGKTMLGKAILSVIRDPLTVLLRYPEIYDMFTKGPRGRASLEGPQAVKLELLDYFGSVEYQVGVLEGCVMSFGFVPRTEVRSEGPNKLIFQVEWQ
jgi:uncharacterized protein (TIGR02265 family)